MLLFQKKVIRICALNPKKTVSEAVFWCRWYHHGELISATGGRYLELPVQDIIALPELFPALIGLAVEHAEIFVRMLNSEFACDLFDSTMCATEYSDHGRDGEHCVKRTSGMDHTSSVTSTASIQSHTSTVSTLSQQSHTSTVSRQSH